MSGEEKGQGTPKVNRLTELYDVFRSSHEAKTVQELEKHLDELTTMIEHLDKLAKKKTQDIKDLKAEVLSEDTGRIKSCYSVAKGIIEQMEQTINDQNDKIRNLRLCEVQKDKKIKEILLANDKLKSQLSDDNNNNNNSICSRGHLCDKVKDVRGTAKGRKDVPSEMNAIERDFRMQTKSKAIPGNG